MNIVIKRKSGLYLNFYPMVAVMSSETSGSCDLTVNCIFTPSESANLARTKTSMPPRKTPTKELNLEVRLWKVESFLKERVTYQRVIKHESFCPRVSCRSARKVEGQDIE